VHGWLLFVEIAEKRMSEIIDGIDEGSYEGGAGCDGFGGGGFGVFFYGG
jgi:hypothetical protein